MEPVEIDHDDLADEYGEDYEDEDEHDAEPLMHDPSRAGAGAGGPSSSSSPSSRRRTGEQGGRRLSESLGAGDVLKWGGASWPQLLFLFLIVVMGMGYAIRLWVVDTTTTTSTPNSQEGGGPSSASPGSFYSKSSLSNDPDRPVPLLNVKNVDYQKVSTLRQRFLKAKDQYMEQLRQDYGPNNFNAMFVLNDVFVGRLALRSAHLVLPESHPISEYFETNDGTSQLVGGGSMGMSWDRMKRKMTMKILQLLHLSKMKRSKDAPLPPMIPFVWATGGHSAAAAHGDLYNESYSAVLERSLRPVLATMGIHFQSRGYAMGGTSSGPEVALCEDAIFGVDIDVLSWDFGMTDGRDMALMELYYRHAALNPNRPAVVGVEVREYNPRVELGKRLEQSGLTVLLVPPQLKPAVDAGIPDAFGLDDTQLKAMPPYVRSFKCEGKLEKGAPFCDELKWTNVKDTCASVKYRTSWHNGWKDHALIGNLLSLSLLEIMDDALADLENADVSDPLSRYNELKSEEEKDYQSVPESRVAEHNLMKDKNELNQDFDMDYIFNNRAYCHTALLPAETRYLGLLTETNQTGFFSYDVGISRKTAEKEASNGTLMRLTYDPNERQPCSLLLQVDYKDFFFLTELEGTKKLVLPNKAEWDVYQKPTKGLIGFSNVGCDWGRCQKGESRETGLELGEWEMIVNGVRATNYTKLANVNFVRHTDGWYFPPNSAGQFEIEIRIKAVGMFLRFSSFIIF